MKLDVTALIEDVESARVRLFKAHCEQADDPTEATVCLASQFLHQASVILECIYGDKARAKEHFRLVAESM